MGRLPPGHTSLMFITSKAAAIRLRVDRVLTDLRPFHPAACCVEIHPHYYYVHVSGSSD
jgi:hypothetical protein